MKKIGKYKILGILGKGGMGIVYKGLDPDIEREVAIKTIRFDTLTDGMEKEELLTRVIREAKAAGRLNHPNIITIYDVARDKDLTYIVMQYIDGSNLQALIESGKAISPQEIIDILKPVADALDFAHRGGIVHRDIKPANIMIDNTGKPFLADFGVARIETSTMTQAGTTVGTLSYMSPEQVKGQTVDKRSDIFALGVILYELLTGKKPFGGDNMSTIVYRIVHEEPERITEINKDLPPAYESVVRRALAKNPEDRYQSCRELIADLEDPGRMAEATLAYDFKGEGAGRPKKRKLAFVLAGALALIVVAGGIFLLLSGGAGKNPGLAQDLETIKKEGLNPATRSASTPGGMPVSPTGPSDETLVRLRENFENQDYSEAVRLAEEVLGQDGENAIAKDILNKAKAEIVAAQVAPLLQSGIAGYNHGQYAQCIADMEKVLKIDKDNKDAQKYIFQADSALAKPEINALIERHRVAEENKDLLTVLNHMDSPTLAESQQAEYKMFFNGYDGIKSIISKVSINFSGRSSATASFSQLLTAVYKKTGQRKIVFEGQKTWQMKKQGRDWKISAIR
ncbi:MAG: serine/threonine protein kinase [Candidatus Aminicenantes bacterium]|nr:serine/threonine protein kinase [Candidatus Aminicenantes bacterium]